MVSETIQLGVKRPQGKSFSDAKLRGFFMAVRVKRRLPLSERWTDSEMCENMQPSTIDPHRSLLGNCAEYRSVRGSGNTRSVRSSRYFPCPSAPNFYNAILFVLNGTRAGTAKCYSTVSGSLFFSDNLCRQLKWMTHTMLKTAIKARRSQPGKSCLPAPFQDNSL